MKTDASKLISEEKFWGIIESSEQGRNLAGFLAALTDDELIGFNYWWQYFSNCLYRQDIWAVAYVVKGGCSDDSFDYFRFWLLTQGRKPVYDAMENADSLCSLFETIDDLDDEDSLQNEEVNYCVLDAMEDRANLNEDFRKKVEDCDMPPFPSDIEFEWDEEDEDSIRAICPRTFARFWEKPDLDIQMKPLGRTYPEHKSALSSDKAGQSHSGLMGFLKRLLKR